MAPVTAIDYKVYFEFPNLTKIHGEPTFDSIKQLHNEIKANSQNVQSNLGGGQYGHLGLVLNVQQYALLSNAPFIRPAHPGVLVIPNGTTNHRSQLLRDQHTEALRVFNEVNNVEKTLRQQIIAAVEPSYLAALRNRQTNSINLPIDDIIQHLYDTYGKITPKSLQDYEDRTKQMMFDPQQPIDDIFNAVMNLADYADAARAPYSQQQTINTAYNIIAKSGKFGKWILEWNRKPRNQQSWINFKQHFREAQNEYRELHDTTVSETEYNQANMIQQIIEGVKNELIIEPPEDPQHDDLVTHMANAAISNQQLVPQLLTQIQQLSQLVLQMQTQMQNLNQNNSAPRANNRYCWTHGACSHTSKHCRSKAEGHKDDASFKDKKGGSTKNCKST